MRPRSSDQIAGGGMKMDNMALARQMIDFYKSSFDNAFQAFAILQEQAEKMLQTFLLQNNWLPDEGRKVIDEWGHVYERGLADFEEKVNEHFTKVEAFFAKAQAEKNSK